VFELLIATKQCFIRFVMKCALTLII